MSGQLPPLCALKAKLSMCNSESCNDVRPPLASVCFRSCPCCNCSWNFRLVSSSDLMIVHITKSFTLTSNIYITSLQALLSVKLTMSPCLFPSPLCMSCSGTCCCELEWSNRSLPYTWELPALWQQVLSCIHIEPSHIERLVFCKLCWRSPAQKVVWWELAEG